MTDKTYIKGKDSDLETSISVMEEKLKSFGFDIEQASLKNHVLRAPWVNILNV